MEYRVFNKGRNVLIVPCCPQGGCSGAGNIGIEVEVAEAVESIPLLKRDYIIRESKNVQSVFGACC